MPNGVLQLGYDDAVGLGEGRGTEEFDEIGAEKAFVRFGRNAARRWSFDTHELKAGGWVEELEPTPSRPKDMKVVAGA